MQRLGHVREPMTSIASAAHAAPHVTAHMTPSREMLGLALHAFRRRRTALAIDPTLANGR